MYDTCLFCDRSLGTNEAIEHFPVGRRVAFDASKGRLWAVCRSCQRWNLSPLDERWEAIEECERLFEGTRLRASTDEIGLARVADGTELVRIGAPARAEFAAWRYGDQFGKRRQMMLVRAGVVAVAGVTIVATHGFGLIAAGAIPGGSFLWQVPTMLRNARRMNGVVARGTDDAGRAFVLRGKHVAQAALVRSTSSELQLDFSHDNGRGTVHGDEAMRLSGLVLARLNANGAARAQVQEAVGRIERAGGPNALLEKCALDEPPPPHDWKHFERPEGRRKVRGSLRSMDSLTRLALEMAVNEENERRALEGELGALVESWKAAEEIAQISDDMFVEPAVRAQLEAIRSSGAGRPKPGAA